MSIHKNGNVVELYWPPCRADMGVPWCPSKNWSGGNTCNLIEKVLQQKSVFTGFYICSLRHLSRREAGIVVHTLFAVRVRRIVTEQWKKTLVTNRSHGDKANSVWTTMPASLRRSRRRRQHVMHIAQSFPRNHRAVLTLLLAAADSTGKTVW